MPKGLRWAGEIPDPPTVTVLREFFPSAVPVKDPLQKSLKEQPTQKNTLKPLGKGQREGQCLPPPLW